MATLLNRNKFIPGGFRFVIPELKWEGPHNVSFDTLVRTSIAVLQGNPDLAARLGWAIDYDSMANRIDAFNANICQANGWTDYIAIEGGSPSSPFTRPQQPSLSGQSARLLAGAKTLSEMFGPEGPVARELAEKRAAVCAQCPLNLKGDWTRFFTVPASAAVREMLGIIKGARLETSRDAELMLCDACGCPIKTKVWARLSHIQAHIPAESKAALDAKCWMRSEGL